MRALEPKIEEIAYRRDTTRYCAALEGLPRRVFLDSSAHARTDARYDLVAADPYLVVTARGGVCELRYRDRVERVAGAPLAILRRALEPRTAPEPRLPFVGGAIGYFAYDFGRSLERMPSIAADEPEMPDLSFGFYDWAVVTDHIERRAWLVGAGRDARTASQWQRLRERIGDPPVQGAPAAFRALAPLESNLDPAAYGEAFARAQDHIRRGDCYQVNLARRFSARVDGDPWRAYLRLRELNPAPYSAYLDTTEGAILCSSPERFLELRGKGVVTQPIKGTRPRGEDAARDERLRSELAASSKDRAENVMIVDLLRNDLGRHCASGSVRVAKLFEVESYARVHHLVSTVEGTLAGGRDALDLVEACFPGGSITGAPKIAAMRIIESLEPHRRGVYCGAIGYLGFDGDMLLNIAIRTVLYREGEAYFWAGGGIVSDSGVAAEYQETADKAAALVSLIEPPAPQ